MSAQPQKAAGLPEKIAVAIVPDPLAVKLDASSRYADNWRSFFRFISTNFNLAGLAGAMILAYHVAITTEAQTKGMGWLGVAVVVVAFIGSMYGSLRRQNLPVPPEPTTTNRMG